MQQDTGKSSGPLKAVINCSWATFIVWFELYVYTAFREHIALEFFPLDDPATQQLQTAGIFAAGFLTRPVGAWLFGMLADRRGRKDSLTISVLLMFFGALLLVLIPPYSDIGVMAPVLLLISRMLQVLSVGGEYGTATTYLSETAPAGRRGLYSGLTFMVLILSLAVATGVQLILSSCYREDQMREYGWRIPFAAGAVLALAISIYLHFRLKETAPFRLQQERKDGSDKAVGLKELWEKRVTVRRLGSVFSSGGGGGFVHVRSLWFVTAFIAAGTLGFYVFALVIPSYLHLTGHFTPGESHRLLFFALLLFAALQPLQGWLSDKTGRRPLLVCFGVAAMLGTLPIYNGIRGTTSSWAAFALIMSGLTILSGYTAVNSAVKAELFPTRMRVLGVGFPYALAVALFGGLAQALCRNSRLGIYARQELLSAAEPGL